MSYNYEMAKPAIFTEEGQKQFLVIRDIAHKIFESTRYVTMERLIAGQSESNWYAMACVDRLVELNEIREVNIKKGRPAQFRSFMRV